MNKPDHVIYIEGVGGLPKEQENLAELWLPHGLIVEHQHIDWSGSDYLQRLQSIGERIIELYEDTRVSLVGASGGGKPALSLFAKYPNYVHRAITISSKMSPYVLGIGSQKAYPNLVISSETFPDSLQLMTNEILQRILCLHPLSDEVVAPEEAELAGANLHIMEAHGHIEGITRAITTESQVIADFISLD